MAHRDWNAHYAAEDMPWDMDQPDDRLVELVRDGTLAPGRAMDVGCGTGTHALWLASQGFDVLGVDVAPLAIERARAKASAMPEVTCRFEVLDFLSNDPPGAPFQLVFDRGCFHVFDEVAERRDFASRVAALLAPGGRWLSLIGSTEGPARDHGPPRRSARDVSDAIEPSLEMLLLRSIDFPMPQELGGGVKAWMCLARRREVPAQPSTQGEG